MARIKKIDSLIYGGFIGPYLLSFFVAEFVLIMQFLWKFIDKILGKGIGFFQIMELLFYMAVKLIPMAIPLTILISSVMVFGNMAEKYELSSIKSAGVSLLRTMRPGLYLAIATAIFSLLCSNYLVPRANFKFESLSKSITKTKPTLSFEEGIFCDDFKGFSIRIGKKDPDGKGIEDIIIEDHTSSDKSLINVTVAKKGEMFTTADGNHFVMKLLDGEQYKDVKSTKKKDKKRENTYSFMRTKFKEWNKVFDMSGFAFTEDMVEFNRKKYDLLNSFQLVKGIDSLNQKIDNKYKTNHILFSAKSQNAKNEKASIIKKKTNSKKKKKDNINQGRSNNNRVESSKKSTKAKALKNVRSKSRSKYADTYRHIDSIEMNEVVNILGTINSEDHSKLLAKVKSKITTSKDKARRTKASIKSYKRDKGRYIYKLNESYSWALVCIIFLFIGAPLGSIIRKGGYGYPLLFAIVFYMLFMIVVIFGQKLIKTEKMDPILAAWLPCMILIPICLQLTYKALNDSKMASLNYFSRLKERLFPSKV